MAIALVTGRRPHVGWLRWLDCLVSVPSISEINNCQCTANAII
jgi:hypothetical protein